MKSELRLTIEKLEAAASKLRAGVDEAQKELECDGVIQRFEFTFELLWKSLKIFLSDQGIKVQTPKESLREAFKINWLEEEKVFLDMLTDRNKTSHIYDQSEAQEIFAHIKDHYVDAIMNVLLLLKNLKQ